MSKAAKGKGNSLEHNLEAGINSRTPQEWDAAIVQALDRVETQAYEAGEGSGRQLSRRKLVMRHGERLLQLRDQGISYSAIAEELTSTGISITERLLQKYLSDYRRQKAQSGQTQQANLGQNPRQQAMDLARRVRL